MTIDNQERRERTRRALGLGFVFSLLVHLVIFAVLGPIWIDRPMEPIEVDDSSEPEELTVEATWEEPEPPPVAEPEPPEPEVAEIPEPEEVPPEPEEEEPEQVETEKLDRKVVEQQTNEEVPEEADFLSEQANKVAEETRARETTLDPASKLQPEDSEDEVDPSAEEAEEVATLNEVDFERRRQPEPQPRPEPRADQAEEQPEEELEGRDPVIVKKRPPPQRLLLPSPTDYERVFAERDVAVQEHSEANRPKKQLFEGYEELNGKVKASLENFIQEVRPGNHTGVNAHRSVYAGYVGKIHRKIHMRWANRYLMDLDLYEPRGSPMNDPNLNTKLEFVIRADDGELESVNIVSGSGQTRFDAQALSIAYAVGPHPDPPPEIVSPDGRVYIHWNFWRDQRQCGTFGASVYLVETDEG